MTGADQKLVRERVLERLDRPIGAPDADVMIDGGGADVDELGGVVAKPPGAAEQVSLAQVVAVDAVQVKVSQDRDRPNFYDVAIHIRPGREILAGRAYLELHLPARI